MIMIKENFNLKRIILILILLIKKMKSIIKSTLLIILCLAYTASSAKIKLKQSNVGQACCVYIGSPTYSFKGSIRSLVGDPIGCVYYNIASSTGWNISFIYGSPINPPQIIEYETLEGRGGSEIETPKITC